MRTPPAVVVLASLLASVAAADSFNAVATFNNIGVEIYLDTPPPPGTTVSLAIKEVGSSADYRTVHPLSPVANDRFAGSAFALNPATAYSLRLSSPAFSSDQFLNVTTRTDSFPDPTGAVYHVAPSGDDNNTGLSFADAFRSVAKGLAAAQPGDEVRLYDGHYLEGELYAPRSGTAANPIVIRNAPGAKPVLDGTDPAFAPSWTLADPANKVYSTPAAVQPRTAFVDGGHLFRYSNYADLAANSWNTPGGYYADGSNLYVRFPNDDPPAAHAVTIPRYTTGLLIENKDYIQLRGLEFAYYGRDDFHRGLYIDGGKYNLVDNCYFHHDGVGVALKRAADFNVIQNSRFSESPVGQWPFLGVKTQGDDYEAGAIYVYPSNIPNQGNVIRRNSIESMVDGVSLYSFASGRTKNLDFHDNIVTGMVDDGLQTDGAGSNVRIYRNTFTGFLTGISLAPASGGPTYVFRNVLAGWHSDSTGLYEGYPFKFNVISDLSTNWVYLYHNTAYTAVPGEDGFLFKGYSDWHDVISRNNIFAGTLYALESWPNFDHPVDFDYDNLYTTDPVRFIWWANASYPDLAAFFAATGNEGNGVSLFPGFIDPATGIFYLLPTSAMIDRGLIIPGINDDYSGAGPDLGAFEFAAVPEPALAALLPLAAALAFRRSRRN